jgi:hypothetical protein
MNDASFKIHIKETVKVLKKLGVFKQDIYKDNKQRFVTRRNIIDYNSYTSYFNDVLIHHDYDILLDDDSYFQFSKNGESYKYVYMQSPKYKISIEASAELLGINIDENWDELESYYEESDDDELYKIHDNPIYLRYENSPKGYNPNVHSYSHLHVGLNENLRIPLSIILTPNVFAMFAVKLANRHKWETCFEKGDININNLSEKRLCVQVPKKFWNDSEDSDLYMK